MEPDWLTAENDTFYTATLGPCQLSVFKTMFGNFSYTVSYNHRTKRAGNTGDLETAKAEALRLARELNANPPD